ncbi:helix-turn-helix transcriptional regulator [Nonomuraea sp. K274]|uniref:Helix-turn-helix transcriptional regulator n=1 Tax=Nonomuraea cypriaca TaxID=1187855 RepID=A0A931ALM8_9ACTN|nr:helix-turn-helix transcriptional regulator [Nonomuraea cypriaca]
MTRVRGHWRRVAGGWTWVREHHRGSPRTAVGVGGGLGVIALVIGAVLLWPTSPETAARSTPRPEVTVTRAPLSPQHAQLAQALRAARQRIGFALGEAGERAGMSVTEIANLESGLITPTSADIAALSRVYQLSPDEWTNMVILLDTIG